MTNATVLPGPGSHLSNASLLVMVLEERLAHRGWRLRESGAGARAGRPEWPSQLTVLVREAESDVAAMFGLAIDLSTMPLRGERFRDVFNSDREEILRGHGTFKLLQLTGEDTWLDPVSSRAFLHGMTNGLSRKTRLAILDRGDKEGTSLADRFAADSNLLVETGGEIATLLQRLYQRTVLSRPAAEVQLPEVLRPSMGLLQVAGSAEPSYPWRR
ncbi:MAG: hypothetical protein M3010_02760 [Candidatus Dormibacteraeota bacterium]|nr:hypothetical protein [Candidatus Dormibacteraeota bacterium]